MNDEISYEIMKVDKVINKQIKTFKNVLFSSNLLSKSPLRASPPVLSMWPCTLTFDERNSTYAAGLVQENSFSPAYLVSVLRLVKSSAKQSCAPAREECNKYDHLCFLLANHNDWSRWFAINSSHLFAVPVSVLFVGCQKYITKLGCEKYLCRVT
jgi:hypothetical protein